MVRIGSSVVDRLAKDDPRFGEKWLEAIKPPFAKETAHHALLEGQEDFLQDAQRSYGHRLDTRSAVKRFPEAHLKLDDWKTQYMEDFTNWNVSMSAGVRRLQVLDRNQVGAILCVARNGTDGKPYITVVAGPVVTPVDASNVADQGAPDWSKTFHPTTLDEYLPAGVDVTHGVVASVAMATRQTVPDSITELVSRVQPVMLTPDTKFHQRVMVNEDMEEDEQPFKALLLPKYCDPVVGLWLPTDIGYKGFLDLVHGQKPYGTFVSLLRAQKDVFEAWFKAAKVQSVSMVINMTDATPLWATFPCTTNEQLVTRASDVYLAPFLRQLYSFLWNFYCDAILCGASKNDDEEAAQVDFIRYLQVVDTTIPTSDRRHNIPAMAAPFIPYLYRMTQDPVVTAWLRPFVNATEGYLQVPPEVRAIRPKDLRPLEPTREVDPIENSSDESGDEVCPREPSSTRID